MDLYDQNYIKLCEQQLLLREPPLLLRELLLLLRKSQCNKLQYLGITQS